MITDEKESIVLLIKSIPVKNILVDFLMENGHVPAQVIDATDTIHYIAKNGIPDSFIVCDSLGDKKETVRLLMNLQKITKSKEIPSVIILTNEDDYFQKINLPEYIHPVKSMASLLELQKSVMDAHLEAKKQCEFNLATSSMNTQVQKALSKSQTVSQIDKVLQLVEDVTRQVADNSLSGPAMPELLQEVRKIITQHNINFADLGKFIRQHQSLALKMLATVNSAYYSRGKKIETIEQAIAALGLKTTYSILQSVATLQYIVGKDPEIQDMIKASLRKAFLVATLSQIVAKYEKFTDLDKAFTVSLFHNLGGTFLLYTYSMLLDKGLVEKVNKGALQTISLKCTPKLNEILSNNIGLPEEIVKMYSSQKSDGLIGTLIQITHKAIFLANRFLEGVEHIAISSEVEIEGIDQGLLDKFNEELPDIKALLQSYV